MKSYGGLMEQIVALDNLEAAVDRAARGKRDRQSVQRLLAARREILDRLREELWTGAYRPLPYTQFSRLCCISGEGLISVSYAPNE